TASSQWPLPGPLLAALLGAGIAGLLRAARSVAAARGLWLAQLLLVLAVLAGAELWYAVYLVPLAAIGLMHGLGLIATPGLRRGLAGAACATLAGVWALASLMGLFVLDAMRRDTGAGAAAYGDWCRRIAAAIPPGSTVAIECVPTPYF